MARLAGKSGNVYVASQLLHNCDAVWNELVDADVTASLVTDDYKVGSGANKFACAAGLANGDIIATEDITSVDVTTFDRILFWIKSSVEIATAGDLAVLLSETALCGGSPVVFDVPALVANTWKLCRATGDMSALNALISVGVKLVANDPGAFNLWIDEIRAAKQVAGIRSWTIDQQVDVLDTTAFDSAGVKSFIVNQKGWSGSFEGYKDGAPLTIGSVVHLELSESATSGQRFIGSAIITNLRPAGSIDGLVAYSYDFQGIHDLEIPTA